MMFPVFSGSNIAVLVHFNIPLLFWNNFVRIYAFSENKDGGFNDVIAN